MKPLLLLIDDDRQFIEDFTVILESQYKCISALTDSAGLVALKEKNPDVVLLDLMLGNGVNGLDILRKIRAFDENLPVIMMTDYASVDTAIEAIQLGANDYISKSPNMKELKLVLDRSFKQRAIKFQKQTLQQEIDNRYRRLVGDSPVMQEVREKIELSAQSLNTVLITGESGVGKEIVARQIYYKSKRSEQAFIAINCAAISPNLIESELFGHEKGAFTGADQRKIGKFEIASNGILFFDEIAELDQNAQVKLLRVIQEKEYERVGGTSVLTTDAKIIAATNRNLEKMVSDGQFRKDLFYRLDVFPIYVPPLRERKSDIPQLSDYFLLDIANEMKIPKKKITDDAIDMLMDYDWPGNVRELRNYLTRAVILSRDEEVITVKHFKQKLTQGYPEDDIQLDKIPETWWEMDEMRKEAAEKAKRSVERLFLTRLLEKFDGNITRAAEFCGLNRTNFHKMVKRCNIR